MNNIQSVVDLFNNTRAKSEGNLPEAHKLAKAAGLPQSAVEYIALSTDWRSYAASFRLLCANMADDESLPVFWRAAALESLGATSPAGQEAERLACFDRAEALVKDLDTTDDVRLYIETCCAAGRAETKGQPPVNLELLRRVATVMVDKSWFNAPGRLKSYCDELVKIEGNAEKARDLINAFAAREQSGDHAHSPRQTGFLKGAHGGLFPAS